MTESTPNNPRRRRPAVDPREAYIAEFTRRITALLSRNGLTHDVDDMVGREVLAVWHDIDAKMAAFPDPGFLAHIRATADRALIGFLRTEKSQRGEGARGGRSVVSLNRRDADHPGRRARGRPADSGRPCPPDGHGRRQPVSPDADRG